MRDQQFESLYAEHARALFGFLAYRTGDAALAEDLLADTFERVLRARRRFDPRKGREKTWIYAIALNCLRDHVRRQSAEARALERVGVGPGTAPPGIELADTRDEVRRAIAALSPEERDVISLRFGADLTVPEMARLLRTRVTTIDGRLYRALRKLRDELDPRSGPPA